MRAAILTDASDNPFLMDGGTNMCITGILGLLVDVVSIPPIPISVATISGSISINDCCTKQGLIPLTLSDGSNYYQRCYYCKNVVEMIISLEAIVAASATLVHWTQGGTKVVIQAPFVFLAKAVSIQLRSTLKSGRACITASRMHSQLIATQLVLQSP
jgi:hypothetical protein